MWKLSVLKNGLIFIPPEVCYNLVKNYDKRLLFANEAKGFTMNYRFNVANTFDQVLFCFFNQLHMTRSTYDYQLCEVTDHLEGYVLPLSDAVVGLSQETGSQLPTQDNLKKAIRRKRKQEGALPPLPRNADLIEVPE